MAGKVNISVEARTGESIESLLSRFRKKVDVEGVLKDYKLNVLVSRAERDQFKRFASQRRARKKNKRVASAIRN